MPEPTDTPFESPSITTGYPYDKEEQAALDDFLRERGLKQEKHGTLPGMKFIRKLRLRRVERQLRDEGNRIDELNEALRGIDEELWPDVTLELQQERQRLALRQTPLLNKRATLRSN